MFSSSYFIYVLLKIDFMFDERNCGIFIFLLLFWTFSVHRATKEGISAMVRILSIGQAKSTDEEWIPVLCIGSSIFKWVVLTVEKIKDP